MKARVGIVMGLVCFTGAVLAAACGGSDANDLSSSSSGASGSDGTSGASGGTSGASGGTSGTSGASGGTSGTSGTSGTTSGDGGTDGSTTTSGLTCTSCHGDPTRVPGAGADPNIKAAPPKGVKGETATNTRAVGAHQAHLAKGATAISNPIACTECHVVPTSTSHSNGTVDIAFGTLAKTGAKTPAWNTTTCTASYCHGNFTGGAVAAAPAWTGAAMTCTSCHAGPPATGDHRRGAHNFACSNCHGNGFTATTVNKALHVNGVKNVGGAGSQINNWNPTTRACAPSCHGSEQW